MSIFFKSITERSEGKPMQSWITFHTKLKIILKYDRIHNGSRETLIKGEGTWEGEGEVEGEGGKGELRERWVGIINKITYYLLNLRTCKTSKSTSKIQWKPVNRTTVGP